jgi:activating signal cointegrator complex subunit 1
MLFVCFVEIQVIHISQSMKLYFKLLNMNLKAMTVQEGNSSGSTQHSVSTSALQPNISSSSNPSSKAIKPQGHSVLKNPPSVSVNLGVYAVEEIQLWVMGSHGPNNEYVSCGGVLLE